MQLSEAMQIIIRQLESGRSLNTLGFLQQDGRQFENGVLFSEGRAQALELHRKFRSELVDYRARVLDSRIAGNTSFMHVLYEFTDAGGKQHSLPGVHVMQWQDGMISREDFWVEDMYEARRAEYFGNEA